MSHPDHHMTGISFAFPVLISPSILITPLRFTCWFRCPLLAIPTAIISFQESEGTGWLFPRVAGCAILLTGVFLASRRLLPLAMKRLVLSDNEKVAIF